MRPESVPGLEDSLWRAGGASLTGLLPAWALRARPDCRARMARVRALGLEQGAERARAGPQVVDQVTKALYEQTMDAQEGVTDWLLDQMAAQHVKELLLAYYLLLLSGAPPPPPHPPFPLGARRTTCMPLSECSRSQSTTQGVERGAGRGPARVPQTRPPSLRRRQRAAWPRRRRARVRACAQDRNCPG